MATILSQMKKRLLPSARTKKSPEVIIIRKEPNLIVIPRRSVYYKKKFYLHSVTKFTERYDKKKPLK